jgi:hypothetical protein
VLIYTAIKQVLLETCRGCQFIINWKQKVYHVGFAILIYYNAQSTKHQVFNSVQSCTGLQCHIISLAMYHTVQSTHAWHCNFSVDNGHRKSRHGLFIVIMCDLMCAYFLQQTNFIYPMFGPFWLSVLIQMMKYIAVL